jgi:hypothetical protein
VKDYLGREFTNDLRANQYAMSISDGHILEQIHSQRFRGVKALSTSLPLERTGFVFVELYVLPWEMNDATINLYGRGGMRICSLTDLSDFKGLPWLDQHLEGYIRCDRLKRTADKTAVVQDEVFRSFVMRLQQLEPKIQELIQKISAESQEQRFNIILNKAGRLIDRFLRYREKGLLLDLPPISSTGVDGEGNALKRTERRLLTRQEGSTEEVKTGRPVTRVASRAPYIKLEALPEDRAAYRSWYDSEQGAIYVNREHAEF